MGMALLPILHVGLFTIDTQAFNSLGQNPCTVVGYLLGTCYNGGNMFSNSCAPLYVLTPGRGYYWSPESGKSCICGSYQRRSPASRLMLVQHGHIQSRECLQRMPRSGVVIVRSTLSHCTASCLLISSLRFRWTEYYENCTTILAPAT